MGDKLNVLIRLHRWHLDEQKRHLADALRALDACEQALTRHRRELDAERTLAEAASPEMAMMFTRYAAAAAIKGDGLRAEAARAEADVTAQREKVQQQWRTLRPFERAAELRKERALRDEQRLETVRLDEIALRRTATGT